MRFRVEQIDPPQGGDALIPFVHYVLDGVDKPVAMLEVGAGEGKFGYPQLIRPYAHTLVGVDPDSAIRNHKYLDDRHETSLEQYSATCASTYDRVFAAFVLEHVQDPHAFANSCAKLIKPGGRFVGLSLNLHHYFGTIARLSAQLGIEDRLLGALRGREVAESYHFKTLYRLNTSAKISRVFAEAGFRDTRCVYFDAPSRFAGYLPKPLRWFPNVWSKLVYRYSAPNLMGMFCLVAES